MALFGDTVDYKEVLKILSNILHHYFDAVVEVSEELVLFSNQKGELQIPYEMKKSSPVIENLVLPHIEVILILSAYVFRNESSQIIEVDKLTSLINRGLNWFCETHITGELDYDNFLLRKRWGENDKSAYWCTIAAMCYHLCKDYIDDKIKKKLERVIVFEANRFTNVIPPAGAKNYSKALSNAENTSLLSWAINLYPKNKYIQDWKKSFEIWVVNIAVKYDDFTDHSRYIDSSVCNYLSGETIFPDLTGDIHGRFNPTLLSYTKSIVLSELAFKLNKRPIPKQLTIPIHRATFEVLTKFFMSNGSLFSPGGNDKPINYPSPAALLWGLFHNDPKSKKLTTAALNIISRKKEFFRKGFWVAPQINDSDSWEFLFKANFGFELALLAIAPISENSRIFSAGQIENAVETREIYPYAELCYQRNTKTVRSVAYKTLNMHPSIDFSLNSYPELIVQSSSSLLGIPQTNDGVYSWKTLFHTEYLKKESFDTYGVVAYYNKYNEKVMEREIRAITWTDDGFLVFDRIRAIKNIDIPEQCISPLTLVNDSLTGNKIFLVSGSLHEEIFSKQITKRPSYCPSFWATVEDRVILQLFWGKTKGIVYVPGKENNAPDFWANTRVDTLGILLEEKTAKPGDIIHEAGFFIGAGKSPRPFKTAGISGELFRNLIIMDGKTTVGLK